MLRLPTDHRLPLHGVAASRAIEQQALATTPPHALMRRAGLGVARLAMAVAPHAHTLWIAAGPGNNGGDGIEAALHLHALGRQVTLTLVAGEPPAGGDAADALQRARAAGVPLTDKLADRPHAPQLAIDALLGLGAARAPQGPIAEAIAALNDCSAPTLAIDLPTGLDADRGTVFGEHWVRARHTLTLLTCKPGLFTGQGRDAAGQVWFDALDVDTATAPTAWLSGVPSQRTRPYASHKGRYGDVVVIGGAPGMAGAALLAGASALTAGAGRVFVAPLSAELAAPRPELMLRSLEWAMAPARLQASTVVCGCCGGDAVTDVLEPALARAAALVLDADALNAIARDGALRARLRARAARGLPSLLTPHPLEAARLLGSDDARVVQGDRLAAAQRLADEFGAVVLLKGSGSIVAAPARVPHINPTGNAALASAGTGDVLAGWIGGHWAASGAANLDGALAAGIESAWRHGAAADAAGADAPLRASELIEAMHAQEAMRARASDSA